MAYHSGRVWCICCPRCMLRSRLCWAVWSALWGRRQCPTDASAAHSSYYNSTYITESHKHSNEHIITYNHLPSLE